MQRAGQARRRLLQRCREAGTTWGGAIGTSRQRERPSGLGGGVVVWTPGYHPESPGSHVLYQLARTLDAIGHPVRLSVHGPEDGLPAALRRLPRLTGTGALPPGALAVYPELVRGNPLRAGRVVRFLLHAPGPAGLVVGPADFVASADPRAAELAFLARVVVDERDAFFPPTGPRRASGLALLDLGPGSQASLPPEVASFLDGFQRRVVISRYHPGSRAGLGELFRRATVLVSAGGCPLRARQALLCGTAVLQAGGPPTELGRGAFTRPEDLAAAVAEAEAAFPHHLAELSGNARRVEALLEAALAHFELLEQDGPAARTLLELGRQAAALRARSVAPAPPPPPPVHVAPPAPPEVPPRYKVVNSLNQFLKQTGPLHTVLKHAVVRAAGFSTHEQSPPVRFQLADTVNQAVKRVPLVHTTFKKAIPDKP